jgi:hypothetical protein
MLCFSQALFMKTEGKVFGVFKRAVRREAIKLQYQNHRASSLIAAFDPALHREVTLLLDESQARWTPGEEMPPDILDAMFRANKALRIAYDRTPLRHIKKFDQEFTPVRGWRAYLKDF